MDGSVSTDPGGRGSLAEFEELLTLLIAELDSPDFVEQYGTKGMKWGVRKSDPSGITNIKTLGPESIVRKTASGKTVALTKRPPDKIASFLAKHSKVVRSNLEKNANFNITDADGKKIGDASVTKINSSELNLMWLGINSKSRGQGYATAVVKAGAEYGRRNGFKKLTLEVPGNAPDARHIYEKMGFKVDAVQSDKASEYDPFWGGLTSMTLDMNSKAAHSMDTTRYLAQYGTKGMRWGVRKKSDRESASGDSVRAKELNTRARASGRDALTNAELQAAINRMNLEQQYDRLKPRTNAEKVTRFVGQQLGVIGKEQASKFARDTVTELIKSAKTAS